LSSQFGNELDRKLSDELAIRNNSIAKRTALHPVGT